MLKFYAMKMQPSVQFSKIFRVIEGSKLHLFFGMKARLSKTEGFLRIINIFQSYELAKLDCNAKLQIFVIVAMFTK